MANINDLRRNNINTNSSLSRNTPPTLGQNESSDVMIDLTSESKMKASMVHNEAVYNSTPKGKTIIDQPTEIKGPDGRIIRRTPNNQSSIKRSTSDRVSFDLTQLPKDKKVDEDIHKSIEDDILTGKNPILYDYINEKTKEMQQWTEEKEDERRLKEVEQDKEISIDLTQPSGSDTLEKEEDNISFDNYETSKEESNDNVVYNVIDSLNIGEDTNMKEEPKDIVINEDDEVELDITEDDTSDDLDLFTFDDANTSSADDVDVVIEDKDDEIVEAVEEEKEVEETPVETVVETKKEEVKAEETSNTASDEEDDLSTFVSANGIEFQAAKSISSNIVLDDDNLDDEEKEEDEDPEGLDPKAKHIIELASRVLKPAAKKLDLSSYTVVKKPGAATRFFEQKQINVAKWVLRNKKVCIHMKASQGAELEELRTLMTDANVASDFIRMYRIIYDHVVSPKPDSFEAWCKSTYTDDLDDYFFCFFIANYMNSNYIPYDCSNENCKPGTFLSGNLPIMSMVKFKSDKDKEEFNEIYRSEVFENNPQGLYPAEIIPFSDKLAIGFKESTLYSFIEAQSIRNNEKFINRYSATIALVPNIDKIFAIDAVNQNLIPIEYKTYPNSNANTYKSMVQKYDAVLHSLTPDEFGTLTNYVSEFTTNKENAISIKYIRPAATCPDCGAKIEEVETTAQSLVFFRYQLGQMVNISIK